MPNLVTTPYCNLRWYGIKGNLQGTQLYHELPNGYCAAKDLLKHSHIKSVRIFAALADQRTTTDTNFLLAILTTKEHIELNKKWSITKPSVSNHVQADLHLIYKDTEWENEGDLLLTVLPKTYSRNNIDPIESLRADIRSALKGTVKIHPLIMQHVDPAMETPLDLA